VTFDGPLLDGRWRLGPRLGAGAQARTYLARDEQADGDRVVVVKQLELGKASGTSWKKFDLFEREAKILEALDHPGIPKFLARFESEPGVYNLVMERAPGATLRSWSAKGKLDYQDLRDILRRTLEILDYLHRRSPPVIHRDIKPANLVRDRDGTISLVDFGGVRAALRPDGGSTVIGTFGYMAPEQLHGQAVPATDLYGLGATIIALAGGVEPEAVPRKGLRMDLEQHLPLLDRDLRKLLSKMTEPDPDDRPASAGAILAELAGDTRGKRGSRRDRTPPRAMVPASEIPGAAIARTAVDDIAEFTRELPGPARVALRFLLFVIGVTGFLSLTIIRFAMLPIVFAVISAFTSDSSKKSLSRARRLVSDGLGEASDGFGALALGRSSRRQLPPADRDDD
jgi:serine/threonine protein kinase